MTSISYGLEPETEEENQQELERMQSEADKWGLPASVYKGVTCDLNMDRTWYCPHCKDHPQLKIGRVVVRNGCAVHASYSTSKSDVIHQTLYCPSHHEVCEYSFANKVLRRETSMWWSKGFKYPLNPIELHELKIKDTKAAIERSKEAIKTHKASIAKSEARLTELQNQTVEI